MRGCGLRAYQDDNASILDAVVKSNREELWCYHTGFEVIELDMMLAKFVMAPSDGKEHTPSVYDVAPRFSTSAGSATARALSAKGRSFMESCMVKVM